jgi:hypothetical protein
MKFCEILQRQSLIEKPNRGVCAPPRVTLDDPDPLVEFHRVRRRLNEQMG